MRHALTVAMQEFEGAMIIVSHDRHLLRTVTDNLLLVANGRVVEFDGSLDDYRQWLSQQVKSAAASTDSTIEENSNNNITTDTDSTTSESTVQEIDLNKIRKLQSLGQNVEIENILSSYPDYDISDSMLFLNSQLNYNGLFAHYSEEDDRLEIYAYYNIEHLCIKG